MNAWHFVGDKLRNGDPLPSDGEVLRHEGKLRLCESGLHASERLIDALKYAPGATLCRVEIGGESLRDTDKIVASKRTILWRVDATAVLRAFGRWCAIQAVHCWQPPAVVLEYLRTGKEEIRHAARAAARDAKAAASDAAWYAAAATARDAAWHAARATAGHAAWHAAWHAAEYAAAAAARDAVATARDAARDAAWYADWDAQNAQLETMVEEARQGRTEWIWEVPAAKDAT